MSLTFSRADHIRAKALAHIDRHYAVRFDAVLGPLASLHLLKRIVPSGTLVPDKKAVLERVAEEDEALAQIDRERRALKAAVRAAATSAEIKALIAHLG